MREGTGIGRCIYKANFRKRVASLVEETDYMTVGAAHRPSRLYVKVQ